MLHKISHKIIFATALVCIAIIGVFSYSILTSQQRALISLVEHHANQLSETIKSSTKLDMMLNQRDRVHSVIDTIGHQEGIEKVRIFNKEGEIIYSSDKTVIGSMVDTRAEACFVCHAADSPLEKLDTPARTRIFATSNERNLGIINPIYNEPSCWQAACHAHSSSQKVLGVLDVTMSLAEVDEQLSTDRWQFLLLAVIAIVGISLLFWISFEKLVGTPVRRLVRATNTVAHGDLSHKLKVTRNDELGLLGNSFNEMTQRLTEAQSQLVQTAKLASLGRLAAGVAHEINNPLTGVLSYSSLMQRRFRNDPEVSEELDTIVRETKRCREIVKQLLDFSRHIPSKKVEVDLGEVVRNALSIVNNRLSLDNIIVIRELPKELPSMLGDPNQILQVFINLLVNAADSIGKAGGRITITALVVTGRVNFIVKDTGCGIPPEAVSKVFEPFYSTKEHSGTGLGLAVVWGIIDKHGGTIDLESEIDRGTTVTFSFPTSRESKDE